MAKSARSLSVKKAADALGLGPNVLFRTLREADIFHRHGDLRNTPKRKYIQRGYFFTERTHYRRGPVLHYHSKPRVTGKGMRFLRELLDAMGEDERVVHPGGTRVPGQQSDDGWPAEVQRLGSETRRSATAAMDGHFRYR